MNEHLSERKEPQPRDIEILIEKARSLAPYEGQPVDWHGSFVTHYKYDDGFVSISVPGLYGHTHEGELFDDTLNVTVQQPLGFEYGHFLLGVTNYTFRLDYNEAEYHEDIEVYNRYSGSRITGLRGVDIARATQMIDLQYMTGARTELTHDKAQLLNELLDSLDLSTKFFDES